MTLSNRKGLMTIGQVASLMGVASTTLRYYERAGILKPAGRTPAGYRLYDEISIRQLEFIRSARAVGFTLDDTRALLRLDDRTSCDKVQEMIQRRLGEVDERLLELKRVRSTLADTLKRCRSSKKGCAVLADFGVGKPSRRKV